MQIGRGNRQIPKLGTAGSTDSDLKTQISQMIAEF